MKMLKNLFCVALIFVMPMEAFAATTVAVGGAAGTGCSVGASISGGANDQRGVVTLNTGNSTTANGTLATVTFNAAAANTDYDVQLTRNDQASNNVALPHVAIVNKTVNGFDFGSNNAIIACANGIKWGYVVTP